MLTFIYFALGLKSLVSFELTTALPFYCFHSYKILLELLRFSNCLSVGISYIVAQMYMLLTKFNFFCFEKIPFPLSPTPHLTYSFPTQCKWSYALCPWASWHLYWFQITDSYHTYVCVWMCVGFSCRLNLDLNQCSLVTTKFFSE